MNSPDQNKAPFKEEIDALRVTLSREERLLQVLASEIELVSLDHAKASHGLAQAQAALDAASLIYRTSETMLHGLEVQHAQLMQNVKEKKAALHPIRRVPAELWADVFTRWADEEEYDRIERLDTHPTDTRLPASLIAASVSSFWRKTALSTPTLWRYISIPDRPLSDIKAHIYEWAKRSSPRIVSLTLWNVGRDNWPKDPTIPSSLDGLRLALSSLKDRIGRLEIHFQLATPAVQIFSSIISEPRVKLNNLAEIWLEYISLVPDINPIIPDQTFQLHRLKRLHTLTLRNLFWNSPRGLKSLRVLKIESIQTPADVNSFRLLLSNSKELEEVEFLTISSNAHPQLPNANNSIIVDYPRLKKLSLCPRWLASYHQDLAQLLTLPALRTLRLISCQVAPLNSREAESMLRFLGDVAPNVECLHFNLRGEMVHAGVLSTRAAITRLEFVNTEISKETIELLTKPADVSGSGVAGINLGGGGVFNIFGGGMGGGSTGNGSRWLLPYLSSIHFEDCDLPPEVDRVLAQLVDMRAEATPYMRPNINAKLERVSVRRNSLTSWEYPGVQW